MGVETEPLRAGAPVPVGVSHRRLLAEMAGAIVFADIVGFAFGGMRFSLGVLFGGVLAFLNYFWLKRSTAAIFQKALSGESGRFISLRFIARYVVIGLIILAVYLSDVVPASAVILGLAAFAFAVVIDGVASIFRGNI